MQTLLTKPTCSPSSFSDMSSVIATFTPEAHTPFEVRGSRPHCSITFSACSGLEFDPHLSFLVLVTVPQQTVIISHSSADRGPKQPLSFTMNLCLHCSHSHLVSFLTSRIATMKTRKSPLLVAVAGGTRLTSHCPWIGHGFAGREFEVPARVSASVLCHHHEGVPKGGARLRRKGAHSMCPKISSPGHVRSLRPALRGPTTTSNCTACGHSLRDGGTRKGLFFFSLTTNLLRKTSPLSAKETIPDSKPHLVLPSLEFSPCAHHIKLEPYDAVEDSVPFRFTPSHWLGFPVGRWFVKGRSCFNGVDPACVFALRI